MQQSDRICAQKRAGWTENGPPSSSINASWRGKLPSDGQSGPLERRRLPVLAPTLSGEALSHSPQGRIGTESMYYEDTCAESQPCTRTDGITSWTFQHDVNSVNTPPTRRKAFLKGLGIMVSAMAQLVDHSLRHARSAAADPCMARPLTSGRERWMHMQRFLVGLTGPSLASQRRTRRVASGRRQ